MGKETEGRAVGTVWGKSVPGNCQKLQMEAKINAVLIVQIRGPQTLAHGLFLCTAFSWGPDMPTPAYTVRSCSQAVAVGSSSCDRGRTVAKPRIFTKYFKRFTKLYSKWF